MSIAVPYNPVDRPSPKLVREVNDRQGSGQRLCRTLQFLLVYTGVLACFYA
jgi:hypothetical protein